MTRSYGVFLATLRNVMSGSGSKERASPELHRAVTVEEGDVVSIRSAYKAGDVIREKYRLVRRLGEGGMGSVWLCRNMVLDSEVALKLLRDGRRDQRLEQRLLNEARAVARLGHPAIVRVFDFGVSELGDPFIVMELLDGEDLHETLERRGRLSAVKAVRTMLPVLHALATAHQKGIVHRDLKPENIFLSSTDSGHMQPKVVDFGIVKTSQSETDRLTRMGTVLGTPAYLCPEQARGHDVDQRADIWSASVVLYEMMTGRLPFEGPNYNALLRSIIEDEPPATTSFGAGDQELWSIISKGLAKDPNQRWQTMEVMGSALANWLLQRGETDDISGASLRAAWNQGVLARSHVLYSGNPEASASSVAQDRGSKVTAELVMATTLAPRQNLPKLAMIAAPIAVLLALGAVFLTRSEREGASPTSASNVASSAAALSAPVHSSSAKPRDVKSTDSESLGSAAPAGSAESSEPGERALQVASAPAEPAQVGVKGESAQRNPSLSKPRPASTTAVKPLLSPISKPSPKPRKVSSPQDELKTTL